MAVSALSPAGFGMPRRPTSDRRTPTHPHLVVPNPPTNRLLAVAALDLHTLLQAAAVQGGKPQAHLPSKAHLAVPLLPGGSPAAAGGQGGQEAGSGAASSPGRLERLVLPSGCPDLPGQQRCIAWQPWAAFGSTGPAVLRCWPHGTAHSSLVSKMALVLLCYMYHAAGVNVGSQNRGASGCVTLARSLVAKPPARRPHGQSGALSLSKVAQLCRQLVVTCGKQAAEEERGG